MTALLWGADPFVAGLSQLKDLIQKYGLNVGPDTAAELKDIMIKQNMSMEELHAIYQRGNPGQFSQGVGKVLSTLANATKGAPEQMGITTGFIAEENR